MGFIDYLLKTVVLYVAKKQAEKDPEFPKLKQTAAEIEQLDKSIQADKDALKKLREKGQL